MVLAALVGEPGQRRWLAAIVPFNVSWTMTADTFVPDPVIENPLQRLLERITALFSTAKPGRFRQYALESCGRLFYAKRADQLCCSSKCNNARLQREWNHQHGKPIRQHQWTGPKCQEAK